jgi:hypothetical protein
MYSAAMLSNPVMRLFTARCPASAALPPKPSDRTNVPPEAEASTSPIIATLPFSAR